MTRGEAINNLKRVGECLDMTYANEQEKEELEAINMAIEALEQLTSYERTINKLTEAISEQATILDKIRAEIVEMWQNEPCVIEGGCLDEVLEIIDKYRGEADCRECKVEHDCYECEKYAESEDE